MNGHNNTSAEHLDSMLAEGRISEKEYETLRAAMERKEEAEPRSETGPTRPKLQRSIKNRQLGGVCAGIGEHLGVDPNIIRIGAVILFLLTGGAAIAVYIVLLFVLPVDVEKRETGSLAVAITLFALWIIHAIFLLFVFPLFFRMFDDFGAELPSITQAALTVREILTYPVPLIFQGVVVLLLVLLCAFLPKKSSARSVLWVGALTSFVLLMVFYVVALAMPFLALHGNVR